MKHVAAFSLLVAVLWWLWQLLTGEWNHDEWIAGAIAAVVAGAIGELAASRTEAHARLPVRILVAAPSALAMVLVDFATLMRVLAVRGEGTFRETPFEHPDDESHRAWATIVGDYSPNAYIVDIARGTTLSHHLVPRKKSQEPA